MHCFLSFCRSLAITRLLTSLYFISRARLLQLSLSLFSPVPFFFLKLFLAGLLQNPATNYLNKHGINSIALVYNPVSLVASVVYHLFLYREMKLVALPVSLFITFSLVASVVLNFLYAVFLYFLFNILLWVIVLWSYKPSKVEFDGLWPTLPSLCDGEEDPCVKNKVENQSNGNAGSSCEVAGDTWFKSENHNNEKDQGNGNAESSCDVAGDTYVESKSENHNNEKDQDNGNGNGKDNDEKYGCSDGCDDDDDGSAGVIGRQDVAEEFDDNLKKRIEDFIAKVNKRWREERLIEASNKQSPLSSAVVRVSTF